MTAMNTTLVKLGHIETGFISENKHSLRKGSGSRTSDRSVKFHKVYDVPPRVVLATTNLDTAAHTNLRYHVNVIKVDTRGFTVRFGTWGDSITYGIAVTWVSIPAST